MCHVEDFQNFHLKQQSVFLVFVAYQEEENSCPVFLYIPAALWCLSAELQNKLQLVEVIGRCYIRIHQ